MSINIDEILSADAFKEIETERLDALKELFARSQGKNINEIMILFAEYSPKLQNGKKLTPEQQRAMMEAVTKIMPEQDAQRFNSLLKMAEMMKKK